MEAVLPIVGAIISVIGMAVLSYLSRRDRRLSDEAIRAAILKGQQAARTAIVESADEDVREIREILKEDDAEETLADMLNSLNPGEE